MATSESYRPGYRGFGMYLPLFSLLTIEENSVTSRLWSRLISTSDKGRHIRNQMDLQPSISSHGYSTPGPTSARHDMRPQAPHDRSSRPKSL
jgi:hypothetical protein